MAAALCTTQRPSSAFQRLNLQASIVTKLLSRSITARHINLQVHQHYAERLHLLWSAKSSERCIERHLPWTCDMDWLRQDFSTNPIPGTCTCIIDDCYNCKSCIS